MPGSTELLTAQLTSVWEIDAVIRMVAAALFGSLIGMEREHQGRSAGFRTQLLVALGAALTMIVSLTFAEVFADRVDSALSVDPARVAYGVMTGIGFLGAGSIIRRGPSVQGITTAASLWCTAAVGLACGFGLYIISAAATLIAIAALWGLHRLDNILPSRWPVSVTVRLTDRGRETVDGVRCCVEDCGGRIKEVRSRKNIAAGWQSVTVIASMPHRIDAGTLVEALEELPKVQSLSVE